MTDHDTQALAQTILTRTAERIRAGWTQRAFARDAEGRACEYSSRTARCFCLVGALMRESDALESELRLTALIADEARVCALDRLHDRLPRSIASWNDEPARTHEEVLALLERVLASPPTQEMP